MAKKEYKVILISMSGVRVYNKKLMELGLTLPGFVERSEVIAKLPSLGLLTIAAYTPPNWNILYKEIDAVTEPDIASIIHERPDIIAFSALTARVNETYQLCTRFRKHGICVVLGGLHASALPHEAIQYANCVIQGEGEIIWPILLNDYEDNKLQRIYSSLTAKELVYRFDDCRTPRYDLLDISKYNRLTLQTTRGCPLHCSFCAASRTISSYKKKPLHQIEKELNRILDIWNKPFIELADDNTFVDKKWSKDLLRMFSKYKLKWFTETDVSIAYDDELLELLQASNCTQVLIGFESSTADGLKGVDKKNWKYDQFENYYRSIDKIQSYGVTVNGCFILGFDTDTLKTLSHTENFIKNSNLSEVQITLLTPFPGTHLFHTLQKENRLLSEEFWDKCTLFDLNFHPKQMNYDDLVAGFQDLMSAIYHPDEVTRRKTKFKASLRRKTVKQSS